ncbi:cell differentiation protein rcd1-like [Diospyros lotus]|uniref:cell differentiation protein rcd1-like n=1 Tax=Diospyros lotus TaxID=55363 RepID=UPI00224D1CE8|nr:cell differentiation protein rcd1-like [Diospyros lotus]
MEDEEIRNPQEEPWEERTLNLLHHSKIDQDFARTKALKSGKKKHKVRRLMKRPMAIPEVIVNLQDQTLRESALRSLSTFLLEKREEDMANYHRTGFFLYHSCSTMAILLQEVLAFFHFLADGNLTIRASKRVVNVLTLFQCIAANKETRLKFVKSCVPNFVIPLILSENQLEYYQNVQAVALSVIGILCQGREPTVIQWALESHMVEVCQISIKNGSELSKVIGMHILEAILQVDSGLSYVCSPTCHDLLKKLMKTFFHLVTCLAVDQDFSPRLLFHIIRCYILLCNHVRGCNVVMENLPHSMTDDSFSELTLEFPLIGRLRQQLLLSVCEVDKCCRD